MKNSNYTTSRKLVSLSVWGNGIPVSPVIELGVLDQIILGSDPLLRRQNIDRNSVSMNSLRLRIRLGDHNIR
eukprot:scaffold518_cov388-Prasinococcus_capsulatus_cf.AAC.80